jgi:two-component system nitrogen regulation sensor histidine kinase NtrY
MTKNKKELLYIPAILAITALLVYLETHLPFFQNFLPVTDNKVVIGILNVNFLLILLLIFLASRILFKAYVEKKRGIWGSRLKTRLTLTVFSISIISSASLFILTTWFLFVSMDKWFSQDVEDTVENARELSQFYYEDLFGRYQRMGDILAITIREEKMLEDDKRLSRFVKREGKSEFLGYLAVLGPSGEPIKTYSTLDDEVNRTLIEKSESLRKGEQTRQIIPLKDGELLVFRSVVTDDAGQPKAVLLFGEKIRVRGTQTMNQISSAYAKFKKDARPLKKVVKYNFVIPLILVAILSIFFSVWIGVKMATEIAIPLERVKEGAAIIAKGRFDISLEDRGKDEIGTLVGAFNRMAKELKVAKDEIEEKTKYMEVIVDNVATGIITTDVKGRILLLNRAARDILKVGSDDDYTGAPLRSIIGPDFRKTIRPFLKGIREDLSGTAAREMTVTLENDTHLRASLTVLRDDAFRPQGFIATFDDITHIMRAEKLATWREIAKRLTHEIKNPLTPIRLSAERLRRRVLPKVEGREKEVLDEATSVILTSSDDITSMVNELNKLSQTSSTRTIEDINTIVEETIGIYRNLYSNISFQFAGERVPKSRMDRDKMKRALINLITNSIKAIGSEHGTITVSTRYDRMRNAVHIEVADTGAGIRDEDKGRVFDPYFTRNNDGMGLGLAIVNSVVLEHGGRIDALDNTPKGARMVIEMPVVEL